MTIAGEGRRVREVAYLGIAKCDKCRKHTHCSLQESAKQARLFSVPVARYDRKYSVVCSACEASWEISPSDKDVLVRGSLAIPARAVVEVIWRHLDSEVESLLSKGNKITEELFASVIAKASASFSESDLGYVVRRYQAYLVDDDKPVETDAHQK